LRTGIGNQPTGGAPATTAAGAAQDTEQTRGDAKGLIICLQGPKEGELLATTVVESSGTVRADGTLELAHTVPVSPGRVKVRVESIAATKDSSQARFRALVEQWMEATRLLSSITEMATHPAYQQIIDMGQTALPWIFEELRRDPDQWFWALQAITGEDPVPAEDRGNLPRMAQVWLPWAKDHGY
jgi:hypothetical protein